MEKEKSKKAGKKPEKNGQSIRISVRVNAEEHARLLELVDELGQSNKSKFLRSCLFNREISVVKVDSSLYKAIEWLTKIHSQYRAIGTNYNQTVKRINACFGEKKAALLLKNLETYTRNLIAVSNQIFAVTQKLKEKYHGSQDYQEQ
ncbi:MAG: MobA protein [Prevotellaceae bacterium]|jgi:hypothetical protein|nr:MobA protein [Prevotellaceae bacterium]